METVFFSAEVLVQPGNSLPAKLDGILVASLKVADHGHAIPIEDGLEVQVALGEIAMLQRFQPAVEKFLALDQVARLQVSGIEHGNQIKKLTLPCRMIVLHEFQGVAFGQREGGLEIAQAAIRQ